MANLRDIIHSCRLKTLASGALPAPEIAQNLDSEFVVEAVRSRLSELTKPAPELGYHLPDQEQVRPADSSA